MIITDADRKEEEKRFKSISSTAQGVGVASARKMTGRSEYKDDEAKFLARDCPDLKPYICSARKVIADAIVQGKRILLEGTQGTSLSLHHSQYPHVTTRDTTVSGCLADAGIAPSNVRKIMMVCRTYPIRVGGPSGDMDYEVEMQEIHKRSRIPLDELKRTETTTTTKRARRIAEFDWVQLKDSVQLNGPTDIALTFVDYPDSLRKRKYLAKSFRKDSCCRHDLRGIFEHDGTGRADRVGSERLGRASSGSTRQRACTAGPGNELLGCRSGPFS